MMSSCPSMTRHIYQEGTDVVCIYDHQVHDKLNYLDRYKVLSVKSGEDGCNYLEVTARDHNRHWFKDTWFVPLWYFEGKDAPDMDNSINDEIERSRAETRSRRLLYEMPVIQEQQFENVPDMSLDTEAVKISKPVGQKWDAGKTDPSLLYEGVPLALALCTRVLDYGYAKYKDAHGWSRVPEAIRRYTAAAYRHGMQRLMGETHDSESDLLHEAHECINRLFVLELKLRQMSKAKLAKEMTYKEPPTNGK